MVIHDKTFFTLKDICVASYPRRNTVLKGFFFYLGEDLMCTFSHNLYERTWPGSKILDSDNATHKND